ncbi:hypothetical protein, variant [Puccinia striiformis f. sp. tritici PST-78]|uniref:Uncharacterized protein n=1 Tax=Puccinia striiformis f. sp. tritici PST-78 TaxID=1165861 RepID=A0A0L0URN7_9BASI|nr:hypothetical protein, variant [Puccinia striiformis f. sp. tritici PST-78]
MLLTKILVALQTLHCYGVSAHPLALLKSLVKRAEGMTTPFLDKLQNFEEHTGPLQAEVQENRKTGGFPGGVYSRSGTGSYERDASGEAMKHHQHLSEILEFRHHYSFAPSYHSFSEDYLAVIDHLDDSEHRMFHKIVKKRPTYYQVGHPFIQVNTLRAILDDSKKDKVVKFFQKYATMPQTSAVELNEPIPSELTATSFQEKIPTNHPAHQEKEKITGEFQALMEKFDGIKKERLANILIADYNAKPPYTTQFLQEYFVNMNDFLSELNNVEKEAFWAFKESYEKYPAISSKHSVTFLQKYILVVKYAFEIAQSQDNVTTFFSMKRKTDFLQAAENNSRKEDHKQLMIFFSNLSESELNLYLKLLGDVMNTSHKDDKITSLFNYLKHRTILGYRFLQNIFDQVKALLKKYVLKPHITPGNA